MVFGTDGLWNVVSPQGAIDNVRQSDQLNERTACIYDCREWINPSKTLVDKALERWSTKKMRADNTSVVVIMFDRPGPPKRDILKSSSSRSHLLGYLPTESDDASSPSQHLEIEPVQNFAMFDHSTNELMDVDGAPLPTSGATVLTRYDNIAEHDDVEHKNQLDAFADPNALDCSENGNEDHYMNSFAESYNSLLNSSLADDDQSYVYDEVMDDSDFDDSSSYENPNATHQYLDESSTYSLHKLQTRSEQQQYDAYASTSTAPMPSTSSSMYGDYAAHNLVDHNYLGRRSTSFPSDYEDFNEDDDEDDEEVEEGEEEEEEDSDEDDEETTTLPLTSKCFMEAESEKWLGFNPKLFCSFSIDSEMEEECVADDSIQINEISSSDNDHSASGATLRKVSVKKASVIQPLVAERITTRSSQASSVRVTRSAGNDKRVLPMVRNLKRKVAVIIKQPTAANGRIHKENISILKKVPVKALVNGTIVGPSRVRNSGAASQPDNKLRNQRTLRSQNVVTKDIQAGKALHRSASQQSSDVNALIHQIGRAVVQAKGYAVSTRANSSNKTATNTLYNNNNNNNTKGLVSKKPPKRLINAESVQIIKSNISHKLSKTAAPTLRFKVVVAKKSVMDQLKTDTRTSVITRRMRLQQ